MCAPSPRLILASLNCSSPIIIINLKSSFVDGFKSSLPLSGFPSFSQVSPSVLQAVSWPLEMFVIPF